MICQDRCPCEGFVALGTHMLRCAHIYRFGCVSTKVAEIEACLACSPGLRDRGRADDEGLLNRHCTWAFSRKTNTGLGLRRNKCTGAPVMVEMFEERMIRESGTCSSPERTRSRRFTSTSRSRHEDVAEASACRQTLAHIGLSQSGADMTI